ncbi:unnamed protein product, partial [Symbiodinium sp. CCMP2456]
VYLHCIFLGGGLLAGHHWAKQRQDSPVVEREHPLLRAQALWQVRLPRSAASEREQLLSGDRQIGTTRVLQRRWRADWRRSRPPFAGARQGHLPCADTPARSGSTGPSWQPRIAARASWSSTGVPLLRRELRESR